MKLDISDEKLENGFKELFFFCYNRSLMNKLEKEGFKAISKYNTIGNNRCNMYWKTNRLIDTINGFYEAK